MANLFEPVWSGSDPEAAEADLQEEKDRIGWNRMDAERALAVERKFESIENGVYMEKDFTRHLTLNIIEPEISKETVKKLHPDIEKVCIPHFYTSRYCFLQLKDSSNVDDVVTELEGIRIGDRTIRVKVNNSPPEDPREAFEVESNYVDPKALYVENLPLNFMRQDVQNLFPKRICTKIGRHDTLKNTRPILVYFKSADDAIEMYKSRNNMVYRSYKLSVKFRRMDRRICPINIFAHREVESENKDDDDIDSSDCEHFIHSSDDDKFIDSSDSDQVNSSNTERIRIDSSGDESNLIKIEHDSDDTP